MDDYKPNSYKSKEKRPEDKKLEKVVSGAAKVKKKSEARKLTDIFISEDVTNVKSYVFFDVLVPAIKKAIDDIVSDGIHMILYGGKGRKHDNRPSGSKVSYNRMYDDDRREVRSGSSVGSRFDYDNIIFDSRGDAESVLMAMEEVINLYGVVRVADLYDLADVTTSNYAANRYGWDNLRNADVVRVRDGWMIKLPRPYPID